MTDYLFNTLNDKEFEELVCDLFSKEFKTRVERFKAGKDGGIDGRFFSDKDEAVIIQAKHYSKFSNLKSTLEHTELPKVRELNPKRYIVVTSLPLSPNDKDEIKNIFGNYIHSTSDIWGRERLNDSIKDHKEVKRHHPKLWLHSVTDIQNLLFHSVRGRSEFELKEIERQLKMYHYTSSHHDARRIIDKNHVLIVTGMPGIGKTTLAKQICYEYAIQDFEIYDVHNIKEAEEQYIEATPQLFYFDDFLGSNFLEVLEKNEDAHIVKFIKRISQSKNKRFVLTSRSNILSRGKQIGEKFEQEKINKHEFEIKIQSLSTEDKSKILYGHLYNSGLDETYIDEIYEAEGDYVLGHLIKEQIKPRYKIIINHKNFNPRLISFITDTDRLPSPNNNYWVFVKTSLNEPKDIWHGVIENQISKIGKHLIVAIAINNSPINEDSLRNLFTKLRDTFNSNNASFYEELKPLIGSVLNRNVFSNNRIEFELFDPSISDYVYSSYLADGDYIANIMFCLRSFSAIRNLRNLVENGLITNQYFNEVFSKCYQYEREDIDKIDQFTAFIITRNSITSFFDKSLLTLETNREKKKLILFILNNYEPDELNIIFGSEMLTFCRVACDEKIFITSAKYNDVFLSLIAESEWYDLKDSYSIIKYIGHNSILEIALRQRYIEILPDIITEQAESDNAFAEMYSYDDDWDTEIYQFMENFIADEGFGIDLTDDEFYQIRDFIDESVFVAANNNRAMNECLREEQAREYYPIKNECDNFDIDDYFNRNR